MRPGAAALALALFSASDIVALIVALISRCDRRAATFSLLFPSQPPTSPRPAGAPDL